MKVIINRMSKETKHPPKVIRGEYSRHLAYERGGDDMFFRIESFNEVHPRSTVHGLNVVEFDEFEVVARLEYGFDDAFVGVVDMPEEWYFRLGIIDGLIS